MEIYSDFTEQEYQILDLIQQNKDLLNQILQMLQTTESNYDGAILIEELVKSYYPDMMINELDWESIAKHIKEYQMHISSIKVYSIDPGEPQRVVETPWPEEEPLTVPEKWPEKVPEKEPEREPVKTLACPMGIDPGEPQRVIETPWPQEEPTTIPEEWPEEAPVEPEREKEPAKVGSIKKTAADEDVPYAYAEELFGWKILNVDSDGTLVSPTQKDRWPVGKPLRAPNFNPSQQIRGLEGIHTVSEGNWKELYSYVEHSNAVLVKCKLYGITVDGEEGGHRGCLRSEGAAPVLVVGQDKELLLKVANKYGIDVEPLGESQEENVAYQGEGFKVTTQDFTPDANYKGFTFNKTDRPSKQKFTFNFDLNEFGEPNGTDGSTSFASFIYDWDNDYVLELTDSNDNHVISAIKDFMENFIEASSHTPTYDPKDEYHSPYDRDYEYNYADYRDNRTISGWEELLRAWQEIQDSPNQFTESPEPDSDDYRVKRDEEPDMYGIYGWYVIETIYMPPEIKFDSNTWLSIFNEVLESTIQDNRLSQDDQNIAIALIGVPNFIENDPEAQYVQAWDGNLADILSKALNEGQDLIAAYQQQGYPVEFAQQFLQILSQGKPIPIHEDQQTLFDENRINTWNPNLNEDQPYIYENEREIALPDAISRIKEADYFYDWQGYYPDDGSLNDGVVQPGGPAPAFMNMPDRCPQCDHPGPAGHLINTDEAEKQNGPTEKCKNCGYAYPMEYDYLQSAPTGVGERWNVLNKVGAGTDIENFAAENGWEFAGMTSDTHWKWTWTDPEGLQHLVVTGNPKKKNDPRRLQNQLGEFKKCMRGSCFHKMQWGSKVAGPHAPKQFQTKAPIVNGPTGEQFYQLQRGMSDREYKRWMNGEPITFGKYFTTYPRLFNVHTSLVRQTDEHTFTMQSNGMLSAGDFIVPVNDQFAQLAPQISKGIKFESKFGYSFDVAKKIVETNLKEFPDYYDKLSSDEDKFSEVDLENVPNGSKPTRDLTMPNRMGPSYIEINKRPKANPKITVIEPEIVDLPAEIHDIDF